MRGLRPLSPSLAKSSYDGTTGLGHNTQGWTDVSVGGNAAQGSLPPINVAVPDGKRWLCEVMVKAYWAFTSGPTYYVGIAPLYTGALTWTPPSSNGAYPMSGAHYNNEPAHFHESRSHIWLPPGTTRVGFGVWHDSVGGVTFAYRHLQVAPLTEMTA